jgi:hypothetical protein
VTITSSRPTDAAALGALADAITSLRSFSAHRRLDLEASTSDRVRDQRIRDAARADDVASELLGLLLDVVDRQRL